MNMFLEWIFFKIDYHGNSIELEFCFTDKTNEASLNDIIGSLAVLCLDRAADLWRGDKSCRQNTAAAQTIHGGGAASNGGNRWFDKTIQVRTRINLFDI